MSYRIKKNILNNITKLPVLMNHSLLLLNKEPSVVYGKKYGAYREFLKSTDDYFDSTPKLLNITNFALKGVEYYKNLYEFNEIKSIGEFLIFNFKMS